ncbi:MAG: ChuX/HutX family heme-like substrate-binding protein [Bacteroidota bacterium]
MKILKGKLDVLTLEEPKLRNREVAKRLNISEAELLSLKLGNLITRLEGDWKALLKQIKEVGYVMALTRNEHCVHERKGIYDNITFYEGGHNMGVAVNSDIDLRFFMNEWKYAFAVQINRQGPYKLYAFQFFNARGEAVHKIYSTPKSNIEVYHELVEQYTAKQQTFIDDIDTSAIPPKAATPDSEIDVEGFQAAWRSLKDTHNFFGLLKKYKLKRQQAFRLAPKGYSKRLEKSSIVRVLELASKKQVPIMCFVHSKGCIQIHTGEIRNLKYYGDWYNVLDKKFNLHLNMEGVKDCWLVKKPTDDGIVTSIELFDEAGELIVYFFGARKPGKPELETWRTIVQTATDTVYSS